MPKQPELVITIGIPASGKSSWAREQQAADPMLTLVDRDSIRKMLHSSVWSKGNEKQVVAVRDFIIRDSLERGRSVICHDTNVIESVRVHLDGLASDCKAACHFKWFTIVPVEECIRRDALREGSAQVGEEVIRRMARQLQEGTFHHAQ